MEETTSITLRLESYLVQLSEINRRWSEWLTGGEEAFMRSDIEHLDDLTTGAGELMGELNDVLAGRAQLLADAKQAGMPSSDLQSLARSLPAWRRPELRESVARARQQLSNLRKRHVATWVLVSHGLQFANDTMRLLTAGTSERDVYVQNQKADTSGGQLLDASV